MPAGKKAVRLVTMDAEATPAVADEALAVEPQAVAAQVTSAEPQALAATGPYLRITLLKSGIGYRYHQKRTLAALGLRRLHMTVERPDNPSVRGMLNKIQHLVRVEEIGQA